MKVKQLILLGMTVVPLLSVAQKPCLFNKGKMSIVGTGVEDGKTVLFVDGDFIISRDETDPTLKSDILVSNSRTVIKGDFIQNAEYVDGTNAIGFSDTTTPGVIVFNSTTQQQNITTDLGYNSLRKGANYINFPTVVVDNSFGVRMAPEVASKAQGLNLTKGKLILDSRVLVAGDVIDGTTGVSSTVADDYSVLAHLEVPEGKITYNRTLAAGTTVDDLGVVEVRLKLDPAGKDNGVLVPKGRSIVGMGSPFNQIASDYFMWNYLMFPYQNSIIGRLNFTETSPNIVIPAGKGFVIGIDLRGTDIKNYVVANDWQIVNTKSAFDQRAKDGYTFNRFVFNTPNNVYPLDNAPSGIKLGNFSSKTAVSVAEAVSTGINPDAANGANAGSVPFKPYSEELVLGDVNVKLINGFNFLANPFMAPLDVSDILKGTSSDWGVTSGDDAAGYDIYNSIWVLNPSSKGSATHNLATGAQYNLPSSTKVSVSFSYLLMRAVGGTYSYTANTGPSTSVTTDGTIAPLQMFLVYANNARKNNVLKIPASKRKISQGTLFLRSTPILTQDDFLFEVRDLETGVFDRVATVIRTPDEIKGDATLKDAPKLITSVDDAVDDPLKTTEASEYRTVTTFGSSIGPTLNSVLYLLNDEGTTLESRIEPTLPGITKKRIPLYLSPSQTKQKIAIRVGRLNTMDRVEKIILEDKLTNNKVEVSNGEDYVTQVAPTDAHDRFIVEYHLRGTSGTEDDAVDNVQNNIFSYYKEGLLTVGGFEDQDMNSIISVYDVQGRLLNQTKVQDLTMEIPVSLASGAYIVKVLGQRSHVSKFLVR